ncbi:hypothetical protein Aduo_007725 [Ancylostoma duodenale]
MIILLIPLLAIFPLCHAKINVKEEITVAITPKIWNLLTTKANFISNVVTSIKFPEFDGKKGLVKYRIWNGKAEKFSVPQSGVSLMDMDNGVHLSIKNVQFHASAKGMVELGMKVFGKWVRAARLSGEIKAKTDRATMDVKLVWNDFKVTPSITMNSNVHVDFTHNLKRYLFFLRKRVQKMITSKVNNEVPKLSKVIEEKVNPRLQQLKQKIIEMGITQYSIKWKVQKNTLRVMLRPKSATGSPTIVRPMDKMLCVDANILGPIPLIREKRKSFYGLQPVPTLLEDGIDFTCVAPQFKCKGLACRWCTDVDIHPSSMGSSDDFHNCLPPL